MKYSIQNHYQTLAKKYDKFWGSSPEFINFLTQKIIESLKLVSTDILMENIGKRSCWYWSPSSSYWSLPLAVC